ncbi:hypothetical protein GCM10023221_19200 [Luteimicrobium xylanilyticum]|uniref:STAS domain-containing protein n=1 Tax=Luteimicrobium xylanilyticum TaxID=1133546 RepID=A0A5P9Q906_9MICO|nr:STAS domain-containing protein [Luteimicrobium xylanilyticum]QFU97849.1 hypothetical protein KDY119_01355 [Luteimicrobium xylanilyticum]
MPQPTTGGIRIERDGAHWVMWGEVDAAVAEATDPAVATALSRHTTVSLDLSDVTFMDSGGLRLLYLAAASCEERPRIVGARENVRDLLELANVTELFVLDA